MSYSLEDFSNECKAALNRNSGAEGTELVRQAVEKACKDNDFIATYFARKSRECA